MQYLRRVLAEMRTPSNKPIQSRFNVNERVLCYEPDLTKARVVYDAKILKVDLPENKKNPTLRDFHYLVHFQGWSSTWDRYVTEEFLLKISTENKALQKQLFKDAEAATAALRKKRKKKRTSSEALNISIEEPSPSPSAAPPPSKKPCIQPSPSGSGSSKSEAEPKPASSPIPPPAVSARRQRLNSQEIEVTENQAVKLPDELKSILERDFHQITKAKILCNLPAAVNVAAVLEDYVRHYAAICLVNYEKQVTKNYYTANRKEISRELLAKAMTNINLSKEIADGLRIIFDFNLRSILLYGSHGESKQYAEVMKPGRVQKRPPFSTLKPHQSRRQSLDVMPVSSHSSTTSSQSVSSVTSNPTGLNPPAASPTSPQAIQVLRDLQEWRLLPDHLYEDRSKQPLESMVYGPIYLLRLFVKLPEVIGKMNMPVKTKKLVIKYMDSVVDYMQRHQDIFIQE